MFQLFIQDIQRWIVPEQVADPSLVTLPTTLKLLWRHMPLRAMLWYRMGSWFQRRGVPLVPGLVQRLLYRRFGLEISPGLEVGGGLYIAHPIGVVIMAKRIGQNCSIIAGVTIGMRNKHAFPRIGDNVFIGAGARVLGDITVGSGAVIGANAVVIKDVPENATAVGIPARVVGFDGQKKNPAKIISPSNSPAEQTIDEPPSSQMGVMS